MLILPFRGLITSFDPLTLAADLASLGLRLQEDLSPSDIHECYFQGRTNYHDIDVSKTANNAMMVGFARELKDTNAQIFTVTPGPTSTDLNGHHPLGKSPAEGVVWSSYRQQYIK
ncbi:hypothetical protein DOT_1000 [Desulfosporosinus sp. OT]|nr:hypothetical protein DOT_1000 [Desulfosporosinus sp. OT]